MKNFLQVLTVLYQMKKLYFGLSGALCSVGVLGPGLDRRPMP